MGKHGSRSRLPLQTAQATCEDGTRRSKIVAAHGPESRKRLAPNRSPKFALCATILGGRNLQAVFPVGPIGPEVHRALPVPNVAVRQTRLTLLEFLVRCSLVCPGVP